MSRALTVLVLAAIFTGILPAMDAVQASISDITAAAQLPVPNPIVNGSALTRGTYAVGQIQLFFTVAATSFTANQPIGTFKLNLRPVQTSQNGQSPAYPVTLNLEQDGSSNLVLDIQPSSFEAVTLYSGTHSSLITITVPAAVASTPSLNTDGTELVGNIKISSSDSHLKTTTSVQVHVRLVYPTACLHMYPFMSDADVTYLVSAAVVTVKNNRISLTPPQLSDNVLIVSTCSTSESLDLRLLLDGSFRTNPQGTPGNAVFTAVASGELTQSNFWSMLASQVGHQQQLCLANMTIPGHSTLLVRAHTEMNDLSAAPSSSPFVFETDLFAANSACKDGFLLSSAVAATNVAKLELPFAVIQQGR